MSARPVGPGFFPLDDRLGVLPHHFSPFLLQVIVRLGTLLPFEQVPDLLAFLTGVHVSADTVRRITEEAGAALVAIEERELERLEQELPTVPPGPSRQQVSVDGAMVPVLHGEWVEVRTAAIGTLTTEEGTGAVHAHDIRYFSRLCSAHDFIRHAALPMYERGVGQADIVVAVMDGAPWLQEFLDAHCPDAVRILDFPHAAEYLAKAAHAAFGAGTREASVWLDVWVPTLKTGEPEEIFTAIHRLPMPDEAAETVRAQVLGYLTTRRAQLAYASFQEAGYPIGSGMVESANKLVVEARLKGSGMHWERRNVSPMLALRSSLCSGRWEQTWLTIWQELRRQAAERRHHRWEERRATRMDEQQASRSDRVDEPVSTAERASTIVDGRPTADHYWRTHPYDPVLLAKAAAKN